MNQNQTAYHTMPLDKAMAYRDKIVCKMLAEDAQNLSDNEIKRVFARVVAFDFCVAVARCLRDAHLLDDVVPQG